MDPIDSAWRIHSAIADWTGKVDAKASFTLTVESAVLAGVVATSGAGGRFSHLSGFVDYLFYWAGIALLVASVLMAAWVVRPRLRHKLAGTEAKDNFIYFGHLRHWERDKLVEALNEGDLLPVLASQVINMSKIAWQKHLLVRYSLTAAVAGATCVAVAAALAK